MNRLALGTVQFGCAYGVANTSGRMNSEEAALILSRAAEFGVDTLDTAVVYGDSEKRLGEIGVSSWRLVTKLPQIPPHCADVEAWVNDVFKGSLARLGVDRVYGLHMHHPADLFGVFGEQLFSVIKDLKCNGYVEKIGVSIYEPKELERIWENCRFDMVQAPFSVVDRRLDSSGWLTKLKKDGVEVHVRSVFLQGLLLMTRAQMPVYFSRWKCLWTNWERWLKEQHLTPLEACLGFVYSKEEIDRIVVGVDNLRHLDEILRSAKKLDIEFPPFLVCNEPDLVCPSQWPVK